MVSRHPNWRPDEVARLIELWNQKPALTGGQIAAQLGKTRNSVLAKIDRLRDPRCAALHGVEPPKSRDLTPGLEKAIAAKMAKPTEQNAEPKTESVEP